jgi:hypothetical protein
MEGSGNPPTPPGHGTPGSGDPSLTHAFLIICCRRPVVSGVSEFINDRHEAQRCTARTSAPRTLG